jgi:hypothetical protein
MFQPTRLNFEANCGIRSACLISVVGFAIVQCDDKGVTTGSPPLPKFVNWRYRLSPVMVTPRK